MRKEHRDPGAVLSEDPLHHTKRNSSPAWSAFDSGDKVSLEQKKGWHQYAAVFLGIGTELQLRAVSLDAGFLLHFAINSKQLHSHVTAFVARPANNKSMMRPSPQRISMGDAM